MTHNPVRFVSIDPGSVWVGVAIWEVAEDQQSITVVHAMTLDLSRLARMHHEAFTEVHGDRGGRLHALTSTLCHLFDVWRPVAVCSEAPYSSKHPQAFEALVESLSAIREALRAYDIAISLKTIDPSTIKNGVGVKGNSGDKELMRAAIQRHSRLILPLAIESLSEHAVDAIAVGYAYYKSTLAPGVLW
jgi:Holliday junction resolvasome RuvABC endonuclease subunit